MKKREMRIHKVSTVVNESEYADLLKRFQSTKFRTLAEYVRALFNQEPVVKRYRNQSLDDVLEALVDLKREVSDMGLKLGDAVGKIAATADVGPDVVKFLLAEQLGVKTNIEHIKSILLKIYNKCGQEEFQSHS
jgi:hypothetical protein